MAKLFTYVIIAVGLMIMMNLAGLQTSTSWIVNQLGLSISSFHNFAESAYWVKFVLIIGLLATVSGIKIGIYGSASSPIFAAAIAGSFLALLVGDLISVIAYTTSTGISWLGYITFTVMAPFIAGYGLALFDWVRAGSD